ncbi:MAG: recombinase family protein [Planctomycetes bacterium]|nr:recombinase family protein [Planctomycetota bacterium]
MNTVIWARVSSREQREGYSIDAQLRATRDKAQREGWTIIREFAVAESAKRGAERLAFNEMFNWVRQNAKKMGIRCDVPSSEWLRRSEAALAEKSVG